MNHLEAWKSVIELSKTIISIASTLLTALMGYYVLNLSYFDTSAITTYIPIFLLILSIILSVWGFGKAISAIRNVSSEPVGVFYINASIFVLIFSILSLGLVNINHTRKSLDAVLTDIERETISLEIKLTSKLVKKVEVIDSAYLITYETGSKSTNVTYSQIENKIIKVE
jgi:hypothetical protein